MFEPSAYMTFKASYIYKKMYLKSVTRLCTVDYLQLIMCALYVSLVIHHSYRIQPIRMQYRCSEQQTRHFPNLCHRHLHQVISTAEILLIIF